MCEIKNFDGGEPFVKPERPFLLIYSDKDNMVSYAWLKTEKDLYAVMSEVKGYGCEIQNAIEIASCRDILSKE